MFVLHACVCVQRGTFVSEPAIVVKRTGLPSQVWTVDKFENKIVDMRDMYEDRKDRRLPMQVTDLTSTTLNLTPGNDPDVDDCSRLLDVVVDAVCACCCFYLTRTIPQTNLLTLAHSVFIHLEFFVFIYLISYIQYAFLLSVITVTWLV